MCHGITACIHIYENHRLYNTWFPETVKIHKLLPILTQCCNEPIELTISTMAIVALGLPNASEGSPYI